MNKDLEVLLQKDAYLDEWSEWSACTLSCIKEGSKSFGTKTRSAKCIEGKNGGQTCLDLIGDVGGLKDGLLGISSILIQIQLLFTENPWMSFLLSSLFKVE